MKHNKKSTIEMLFIISGILLPIINVIVFWGVVNVKSILMAFQFTKGSQTVWSFQHFTDIFSEIANPLSKVSEGLTNTMIFFCFYLVVQLSTTYIVSFLIYKKIPFANGFRYIFFIPSMVSAVVIASFIKFMAAPGGPFPEIWNALFGIKPLFFQNRDYAMKAMLLYQYWVGFGAGILLYVATFARIPQQLVESGRLEGMSYWGEIRHIVFPLTWPFFSTQLLIAFCGMLGTSGPVLLFTNGTYGTYTLSYWIFEQTLGGGTQRAAALGLIMTAVSLPLSLYFHHLADKVEPVEY